jgi:hypothetical protein
MKRLSYLVLLTFAGCGSGAGSTVAVDDFIQSMAASQCEWEFRCCNDAEIMALDGNKFSVSGQCTPYRALALQTQLYIDRLAAAEGRLKVDPIQAEACLGQMQARACNPRDGETPVETDPMAMDECAHVFIGTTSIGHECVYTNECERGSRCISDTAAVGRGVCVPYQNVGDICNVDNDCDPGVKNIYCSKADYHCHTRGAFGQPCQYTTDASGKNPTLPLLLECDSTIGNLYCDPIGSTCKQLPVDGDPCIYPLPPGVSSQCNPDPKLQLVCDHGSGSGSGSGSGGICRAPAGVGQSCQSLACAKDLYCDTSVTYKCKALPGLGQVCSTTGYRCAEPYFCAYNSSSAEYLCDQPAAIGEPCVSPSRTCDVDAYCDSSETGDCQAKRADGASCTSSIQCESSSCGFTASGSTEVCLAHTSAVACTGH